MVKMPVLFIGHGSPMNAIEENEYTASWRTLTREIPKPKAILSISAHWYTRKTRILTAEKPKMIYDMYGFPKKLYEVRYPVSGAPGWAENVKKMLDREVIEDNSWGIDHGSWAVLCKMYPAADIPVFQLSVDADSSIEEHFGLGKQLAWFREQGILIFASGNVVHNLGKIDWKMTGGYDWARQFDQYIEKSMMEHDTEAILHYADFGNAATLAVPTPEHFYPLLYAAGASDKRDRVRVYNTSCVFGSLSMTSYLLG
jgi:4,5-DOPA dioxygenase extradiol